MPYASNSQRRLMRAVAHGWTPDRLADPPSPAVARKFEAEDSKSRKRRLLARALRQQRLDEP